MVHFFFSKTSHFSKVTWYKDGRRVYLDHNHVAERHDTLVMLRLREITITDLGNYTCEAENTQGTARDHIELSGNFLEYFSLWTLGLYLWDHFLCSTAVGLEQFAECFFSINIKQNVLLLQILKVENHSRVWPWILRHGEFSVCSFENMAPNKIKTIEI